MRRVMKKNTGMMINDYKELTHRIGRIWTAAALLLIISVPLLFCLIYGVLPDWDAFYMALSPLYRCTGDRAY